MVGTCVLPLRVPEGGGVAIHGVGSFAVFASGFFAVHFDDLKLDCIGRTGAFGSTPQGEDGGGGDVEMNRGWADGRREFHDARFAWPWMGSSAKHALPE